jgi:hypothetical protein
MIRQMASPLPLCGEGLGVGGNQHRPQNGTKKQQLVGSGPQTPRVFLDRRGRGG